MRIAGLGGLVAGVALAALSISRTGFGVDPGAVSIAYPFGYLLCAVALLAADARYGAMYGRRGRRVAALLALSLACYGCAVLVIVASLRVVGVPFSPVTGLVGVAFFAIRVLGSLYGVLLWRETDASRLTAGLFVAILPAMVIFAPLAILGFPAFGVEGPLYLAFVALGHELSTVGTDATADGSGRPE
ncbi:hypothetical protein HUG10_15080 [Halorarum halophilum]|uniref:Uncharacterized protein n=1 Tax=Halorarum halophilum TaxID=2743090 RepID=A0A7D5KVD9_9EURY|nr:hypothetical protein [Halobaculum halophilum]QLG28780.1 hypothetical protein HUG10_15080 [Halobaculum halophilum]